MEFLKKIGENPQLTTAKGVLIFVLIALWIYAIIAINRDPKRKLKVGPTILLMIISLVIMVMAGNYLSFILITAFGIYVIALVFKA